MNSYKFYISKTEYIDKNDYNKFLKNLYNNLKIGNNIYDIPIFLNTMCNCNANSLTDIKFLTSASNDVYTARIKKNCITNSTYFNTNVKKIILKVCNGIDDDDDEFNEMECLYVDELISSIYFSKLVVKNITSNLLLLFGYMNKCSLNNNEKQLLLNKKNESALFNNYVNGVVFKELKNKLTIRQVFELFYTIICCYASYGFCISDINLENFMTSKDSFKTCIKVYDKIFYFQTYDSVCIIDYQTNNTYDSVVNLKKYIRAVSRLLDDNVKEELLNIDNDRYDKVLRQFINCNCFKPYLISSKIISSGCRNINFDVISRPLSKIKSSNKKTFKTKSKLYKTIVSRINKFDSSIFKNKKTKTKTDTRTGTRTRTRTGTITRTRSQTRTGERTKTRTKTRTGTRNKDTILQSINNKPKTINKSKY